MVLNERKSNETNLVINFNIMLMVRGAFVF